MLEMGGRGEVLGRHGGLDNVSSASVTQASCTYTQVTKAERNVLDGVIGGKTTAGVGGLGAVQGGSELVP